MLSKPTLFLETAPLNHLAKADFRQKKQQPVTDGFLNLVRILLHPHQVHLVHSALAKSWVQATITKETGTRKAVRNSTLNQHLAMFQCECNQFFLMCAKQ